MREKKVVRKGLVFKLSIVLFGILFVCILFSSAVAEGSKVTTEDSVAELEVGSYIDQQEGTAPAYVTSNAEFFTASANFISGAVMGNITLVFFVILLVTVFIATFVCSRMRKRIKLKEFLRFCLVVIMIVAAFAVVPMNFNAETGETDNSGGGGDKVLPQESNRQHIIIQLDQIPKAAQRESLETSGIILLQYIQDRCYYASVEGELDTTLPLIQDSREILPADRLALSLQVDEIPDHAIDDDSRLKLSVLAFGDVDLNALSIEIEALEATVDSVSEPFNIIFIRISTDLLQDLASLDGIHWIDLQSPAPKPEMSRARGFLGTDTVHDPPYELTGAGVDVSVHDEGYAFRHSDYYNRWSRGDTDGQLNAHASMTAGTIAGDGTLNANYAGMAPGASIVTYAYGTFGSDGFEENNYDDIADALGEGVEIMNNSWGYGSNGDPYDLPYGDYTLQASIFDQAVLGRNNAGVSIGPRTVVVFSAGNERDKPTNDDPNPPYANYSTINQPKPAKNIITVGGIDSANDRMSTFSSWGPVSDGRLKPDIVAGGLHGGSNNNGISEVTNAYGDPPDYDNGDAYRATGENNEWGGYKWFGATSAAAAMVSGNAALFIEDFRTQNSGRNPWPATVKGHFIHTASDLDDDTTWYNPGPDYASGYGVLNIQAAIDQLRSGGWLENIVRHEETKDYILEVPEGTSEVKITLVWDDAPSSPVTTESALINDLDLVVTDPNGVRYYPWTLDPENPADDAVRTTEDHLNNVEMVLADGNPPAGIWSIQVVGYDVPSYGSQEYSLICSPGQMLIRSSVQSCDWRGNEKNHFLNQCPISETIYITGKGGAQWSTYEIFLVDHVETWTDGMTIPERISGTTTNVSTDWEGEIIFILGTYVGYWPIWIHTETYLEDGTYDIVLDINDNGLYDVGIDALDNSIIITTPEVGVCPTIVPMTSPPVLCRSNSEPFVVSANGLPPNTEVTIHMIPWFEITIPPIDIWGGTYFWSYASTTRTTNSNGRIGCSLLWEPPIPLGNYRIFIDVDQNGQITMGDCYCNWRIRMDPPEHVWVDKDYSPSGYNDGHTWGLDAFDRIQDGIDAVSYRTMWSWGNNSHGQLGDDTTTNRHTPKNIGKEYNWLSLATKGEHTVAITPEGTLWTWGDNSSGQLGDGTTTERDYPRQIGTDNDWKSIAVGEKHTLALKSDGSLWAWGENNDGQLGDGTTDDKHIPTRIGTDDDWVSITAGFNHSFAMNVYGQLCGWGRNSNGQLGDGTTINRHSPVHISTSNGYWTLIAAGAKHTLALKSNGNLWAWGANNNGQLGDGTWIEKHSPTQIGTYNDWSTIAAGRLHSLALKSGGSLYAWGSNNYGELGDGTSMLRRNPTSIGYDYDWISIAGGSYHSSALKADGTLWAWGRNNYGQLGDGTTTGKLSPTQIGIDNDWHSIALGANHTIALKAVYRWEAFVHVAPGIYHENFTMKDGINILGAGEDLSIIEGPGSDVLLFTYYPSLVKAFMVDSRAKLDGFTITDGFAKLGGGMYNHYSSPTISNCTFKNNVSDGIQSMYGYCASGGGGIFNFESSPTIINCNFFDNSAEGSLGSGGGISNWYCSSPKVINCIFSGNFAEGGSYGYGGGAFFSDFYCEPIVTNCTFSHNSALNKGGGIFHSSGSLILNNSILWGNTADVAGPQLACENISSPDVSINNSVLQGGEADVWSFSDFEWGIGNIDQDPLFADPDGFDNILGTIDDDVHLQPGSPCIDTGDNSVLPTDIFDLDNDWDKTEPLPLDFEGNHRIIAVPCFGDDGDIVDMGADEYPDDDCDGISYVIDTSEDPSRDFSDGITTGTIEEYGDQLLLIRDLKAPEGVIISASQIGGTTPATVSACGGAQSYTLDAGDIIKVLCGSATVTVMKGTVEITLFDIGDWVATTSLIEGNSLNFDPITCTIIAGEYNTQDIVLNVEGEEYLVIPGEEIKINRAPIAEANGPYEGSEGTPVVFDASGSSDIDEDDLEYRWDFNNDGNWDTDWSTYPTSEYTWYDNHAGIIKVEVSDGEFTDTDTTTLTVNNVAPIVTIGPMIQPNPQFILPLVHELDFSASFTDDGTLDTHTALWSWGDSTSTGGTVTESDGSGTVTGSHTYSTPGVYTVTLTVTDDDGGKDSDTMKVTVIDAHGALNDLNDYIQDLDNDDFKGNAKQRKKTLGNKIDAVHDQIDDEDYKGAIQKLQNDIRSKADGHVGGKPKNDWIIDKKAQEHICMKIDDIMAYLKTYL